jgi:hypothetical protein
MIPADPVFASKVTIANGATASSAAISQGYGLVGIATPAALTSTTTGLELSFDQGATWLPVKDQDGNAIAIALGTSRYVALSLAGMPGLPGQIRLAAGSAEGGDRTLTLFFRQLH